MFLYAKPTIAVTQVKSDDAVKITRETAPALISQYGLEFASHLIDDLLREREEIEDITSNPYSHDSTLVETVKIYGEMQYDEGYSEGEDMGALGAYDEGYADGQAERD